MATFFANNDATLVTALADAAANGPGVDTIMLEAGTYSAAHTINTAVIIQGAKVGQTGDAGGRGLGESVLSGGIQINAAGVTIDGVQVSGENTFSGALVFPTGIYVASSATGATIQNIRFTGTSDAPSGVTAGLTLAATGATVTRNAFTGYDDGIYAIESSAGSISINAFSQATAQIGVFTESTGFVISQNTFVNAGGAGAAVFSNPLGGTDLSTQVLANNTIPSLPGGAHSINIDVRGTGAFTITGTVFDDAIYTADDPNHGGALTIFGLGGNDEFWGGLGNDIFEGGAGADILHGQGGADTASYSNSSVSVQVDLNIGNTAQTSTGDASGDRLFDILNVRGSAFNDTLTGDGGINVITGGGGIDTLTGGAGNDTFVVNAGDVGSGEIYNGGADSDTLQVTGSANFTGTSLLGIENLTFATAAASIATFTSSQIGGANLAANLAVTGDGNTNSIVVNMDGTLISLSAWTFTTWTAADTITINGTSSADTITGSVRNDIIRGGQNNDLIDAGAGDDVINYTIGDGSDSIDGGSGGETAGDTVAITGTAGNDTLAVIVNGGVILGFAGGPVSNVEHFTAALGTGTGDTLDYTGTIQGVTVNLSTPLATGFDSVSEIENVTGSSGMDLLTGDGNANTLDGAANDDTLTGLGGVDTLLGKAGNDTFVVGAGDAVAGETYDGGTESDTLRVTGTSNFTGSLLLLIENLTFATSAASTVTLTSSQIGGGNLSPTLAVTGDANTNNIFINMNGAAIDLGAWTFSTWTAGTDTISIAGSSAANTITGSTQDDIIAAGNGADTINAGTGNDLLVVAGNDVVAGETYNGGANTDTLLVLGSANFTGSTLQSIEALTFQTGGSSTITFTSSQIGGANLSTALAVTGDASPNHLVINMNSALLDLSGWTFSTWTAGVDTITITGSGSDDAITASSQNDIINGGIGNDNIAAGTGDDIINYVTGQGADTVNGGGNTATGDTLAVTGTSGNDTLAVIYTGTTFSTLAGGTVTGIEHFTADLGTGTGDTLDYTGSTAVTVNLSGPQSASGFDSVSGIENVTGGSGADSLTGSSVANVINGGTNNDTITGLGGLDILSGGDGNDTFVVNAGDTASGETYDGGGNSDTLEVRGTADFTGTSLLSIESLLFNTGATSTATFTSAQVGGANLSGSLAVTGDTRQNNIVVNMNGTALDLSGWGFTTWTNGLDTITINGTAAANTIIGSSQNDIISGGAGLDSITAGIGDDLINYVVGDGPDVIDGGANTGAGDTVAVTGTSGNDTLSVIVAGGSVVGLGGGTVSSVEHATLDLGAGSGDTLDYTGTGQVVAVNLTTPSATGFDSIAGVENVTSGSNDDTLTGTANANVLDGGSGGDTLTGSGGADTLLGKAGNDTFIVNASDAVAGETYDGGTESDTLQVTGTANFTGSSLLSIEKLTFATSGASTTTVTSSQLAGANLAAALAVTGDANTNIITLNMNTTSADLSGWTFATWSASDAINVFGSLSNDTIIGSSQSDTIVGDSGADVMNGGGGDDVINGGLGADVATGGAGADLFRFGIGIFEADVGIFDRLTDYNAGDGDQIDLTLGLTASSLVRAVASGTGANLQVDLDGTANGANWITVARLDGLQAGNTVNVILPAASGSITVQQAAASNDFGGDGKSDIFWRTDGGSLATWEMNGNQIAAANFTKVGSTTVGAPNPTWHVVDTGDFNGDLKSDVLWMTDSLQVAVWQMNGPQIIAADFTKVGSTTVGAPGADWHIAGTTDFDGDGKSDILWRTDGGALAVWEMNGPQVEAADFTKIGSTTIGVPGPDWHVVGLADFDGDGKGGILWRTNSGALATWEMNGTQIKSADFLKIGSTTIGAPGADWHVVDTGDFDGDDKSDILWRTDGGALAIWEMNGNQIESADFIRIGSTQVGTPGPDWHIVDTGDYDGDGKDDLFWQTDGGSLAVWKMNGNQIAGADFTKIGTTTINTPGADWHVIQHQYDLI